MKLYTKRGDDGGTELFGGKRIGKDSLRVAAYGSVDELNSAVGLAVTACRFEEISVVLGGVQRRLFELGADLATPRGAGAGEKMGRLSRISADHISEAEAAIDAAWAPLPEMKHFILPGGSDLAARLHLARSVCRRAERDSVALSRLEDIGPHAVIYLNRLSDLFFALARRANQLEGVEDVPWKGGGGEGE